MKTSKSFDQKNCVRTDSECARHRQRKSKQGAVPLTGATYGQFVDVCAAFGIRKTMAYAYKKAGLLHVFRMPGMSANYIYVKEVEGLPDRITALSGGAK